MLIANVYQEKLEGVIELPESLEVVKAMLSFLYKRCYLDPATRPLEFHAQVYAAANKYNIISLKYYATYGKCKPWLERFTSDSQDSSTLGPALIEFLDAATLVYTDTHEESDNLRRQFVIHAQNLLRSQRVMSNDAWLKCFGEVPEFAFEVAKPMIESRADYRVFHSWEWRTAKNCVMRECSECDTAVLASRASTHTSGELLFEKDSKCPRHKICGGTLEIEMPIAKYE